MSQILRLLTVAMLGLGCMGKVTALPHVDELDAGDGPGNTFMLDGGRKEECALGDAGLIDATDHTGRTWRLEDWSGCRPYPKELGARESAYRERHGEEWDGPAYAATPPRIMSPGDWRWEVLARVEEPLATILKTPPPGFPRAPSYWRAWGGRFPRSALFAPAGGTPADLYVVAGAGFWHLDLRNGRQTFIGNPTTRGAVDGAAEDARIDLLDNRENPQVDRVTGRLYFLQDQLSPLGPLLRTIDKLLPYRDTSTGLVHQLPAFLDEASLWESIPTPSGGRLELVLVDGKRPPPRFEVRTLSAFEKPFIPGSFRGRHPLLSVDGQGIFITALPAWRGATSPAAATSSYMFDVSTLRDVDTGANLGRLAMNGPQPVDLGEHGGTVMGLDGLIYTAQHGGCCWYQVRPEARLFSLDPKQGALTVLYQTAKPAKKPADLSTPTTIDGPADSDVLAASSTDEQEQCPRTGAIFNGGWDESGIRRYQDGFVTTLMAPGGQFDTGTRPRPTWTDWWPTFRGLVHTTHFSTALTMAPTGDLYIAAGQDTLVFRVYRADWPATIPPYAYGETVLPRAQLLELMRARAAALVARLAP